MKRIFGIRRDEWWLLPVAAVLMTALNALMLNYNHGLFTRGGNLAYYGLFYNHFALSGYDDLTYITLSNGRMYYSPYRHPLLTPLMYPLYLLNRWQMEHTDMNIAIYIVAAILIVCGVCSFLFFHRTMREVVGLGRGDSFLTTMLFFSFAHVMVAMFAPDHFGVSLFLLMLTLYVAGIHLREKRPPGRWSMAALYLVTAGVTLTNGVKTLLAALFCNSRRFFAWRNLAVTVALPTAILLGAYFYQYCAIQLPEQKMNKVRMAERMKRDKKFALEQKEHQEWKKEHAGEQIVNSPFFEWTDKSTSRLHAAVENLFGESIQLHRSHLLEDTNRTRPNYVAYGCWSSYAIEALIFLLFAAGLWLGRRDRFVQLCLSWLAVDMVLHLVLGFAILEVYIMAVHWIFIIPIAIAVLLRSAPPHLRPWLRGITGLLAAYLWIYNGSLVVTYMMKLS